MSDLFPERIVTDRLELTAAGPDAVDIHELYRICSADDGIEAVTEYVTWEPHPHPRQTEEFLELAAEQRANGEVAHYVVRPRDSEDGAGEFAGASGLTVDWDQRLAEPGIWLRRRFWGRGYSGERAAALLQLAFDRLDLDCVAIPVHEENEKSRRAVETYVERFGGRYEGLLRNVDAWTEGPVNLHRFSVTAEEYAASDPERAATFD
jgi:RimJ/RimL family protein N-acetyltransferase